MAKGKVLTLEEAEKNMAENDGDLDLCFSDIAELPKGLKVEGDLWLQHSEIQELPEDLVVMGSLDLRGTRIAKLPDGLSVAGFST